MSAGSSTEDYTASSASITLYRALIDDLVVAVVDHVG
jgi:hypothetical protein